MFLLMFVCSRVGGGGVGLCNKYPRTEVPGQRPPWTETPGSYFSGLYASYWNASLSLSLKFQMHIAMKTRMLISIVSRDILS